MNERNAAGRRVAFFGGSFDPPHMGHLAVARAARAALGLDAVLFAPVGAQPLKPEGAAASFGDRLAMTRLTVADEPGFEVSLVDAPKPSGLPNYTLETLLALRAELAVGATLFCLMGADAFLSLRSWRGAARIPFVAPLIVASRPGLSLEDLKTAMPEGLTVDRTPDDDAPGSGVEVRLLRNQAGDTVPFYLLPGLYVDVSATDIRREAGIRRLARSSPGREKTEKEWLPGAVADYIQRHGLYR